jgi:hypothetical protein
MWVNDIHPNDSAILRFKVKAEYTRLENVKVIQYPVEIKFKV